MLISATMQEPLPGHLAQNVLHFVRLLRRAGLPVGTDRALLALTALTVTGIESRENLHSTLKACLIDRADHSALFDQAFYLFWRDPDLLGRALRLRLPAVRNALSALRPSATENRRLSEALSPRRRAPSCVRVPADIEREGEFTWSDRERLGKIDFDTMSAREWAEARRAVSALALLFAPRETRRFAPATRGSRVDLHKLLRDSARRGGIVTTLPRRQRRQRPEPLVVLIDISGSMSRYSRMFLHFVHALASGDEASNRRVQVFVFGTRLTHITRQLTLRDPDEAIAGAVRVVPDWSGGTRIARCLREFNLNWSRRVMSGGPTVLLLTDGLERADQEELAGEMRYLARSCRRVLWLNPLLRYASFEPRAAGIRAMLPHVDRFLPVHNLESLEQLAAVLNTHERSKRYAIDR